MTDSSLTPLATGNRDRLCRHVDAYARAFDLYGLALRMPGFEGWDVDEYEAVIAKQDSADRRLLSARAQLMYTMDLHRIVRDSAGRALPLLERIAAGERFGRGDRSAAGEIVRTLRALLAELEARS